MAPLYTHYSVLLSLWKNYVSTYRVTILITAFFFNIRDALIVGYSGNTNNTEAFKNSSVSLLSEKHC